MMGGSIPAKIMTLYILIAYLKAFVKLKITLSSNLVCLCQNHKVTVLYPKELLKKNLIYLLISLPMVTQKRQFNKC